MIKGKNTKTSLVGEIRAMLAEQGMRCGYCYNLDLPISDGVEIVWVSTTQILLRKHIDGAMWKLYRQPLYSKETSIELLTVIRDKMYNELKDK